VPPSLEDIRRRYPPSSVEVVLVPSKGRGVRATHAIAAGETAAYYLVRRRPATHPSEYLIGSGVAGTVLDLFAGSFPPAGDDGIPYVGPYANEPTLGADPNCYLRDVDVDCLSLVRRFSLVTLRPIAPGEELCWDYGESYGVRDYPSNYRNPL
jgi:hypothetical protein